MYFVVLVSDDSTNFESVLKKNYHNLYQQLIFTFFQYSHTVSPRIGRTSVPKKSRPIWNRTIGIYTITYAENHTISRKSH